MAFEFFQESEKLPNNDLNFGGQTFPYPYSNETNHHENKKKKKKARDNNTPNGIDGKNSQEDNNKKKNSHEPIYHIVHRGVVDFQNFTNAR